MRSLTVCFLIFFSAQAAFPQTRSLEDYFAAARRYNATLIDDQNQLTALGYDSSKIRSTFLPKVNFTAQAMMAPVIGGFGYDSAISNGSVYSALFAASQDLFQGGNRDLQLGKLGAQRQSLTAALVLNERDLFKSITAQYIAAYSDLYSIHSAEESMQILDEQAVAVKELINKGVYLQLDYLNLEIARNQQQIALLQARMQYRSDLFKLNQMAGISDTAYTTLPEPEIHPNPAIPLSQTLRARQFTFDSLAVEYDRSLLDWTYNPKLGWFADAGLNTTYINNAYHNLGFSFGLNLSIPIYDGGQKYFENEKFDLTLNTLAARSRAYLLETSTGRLILEEQLRGQDSLLAEYRKQLASINDVLQYQKQILRQGTLKITDLLLTINSLNTTRLSMRQAEIARLGTVVELNSLNQ